MTNPFPVYDPDAPEYQDFKEMIVTARKQHGYTVEDVALRLGLHRSAWIMFENGTTRKIIKEEKMIEACELLDLDPYLVFWKLERLHPRITEALLENYKLYQVIGNVVRGS